MEKQQTCEQQVNEQLKSRIDDLQKLWKVETCEIDDEQEIKNIEEDIGTFNEYGLCFDYVAAGTFDDQDQGYFRYQLSCGGPSDEFRFYTDGGSHCYKIEYVFMDWFDGTSRPIVSDELELLGSIWDYFDEIGIVAAELAKAID